MKNIQSKTIMFVTGSFVTNRGWITWQKYFEDKGYKTVAPAWPFKDGSPQELRAKHPLGNPGLSALTLPEILDHYANIAKGLPEKPVIIGHSFGGLMTQILINRDLGAAGVAIHSAPPQGIFPYEFSFLRAGWRALGIFTSTKKTYLMSFKKWQYAFTDNMPLEEQKKAYEENIIPESITVTRSGLTSAAKVDFAKPHAPLLLTAGSWDNILPAHLNRRNFKAYKQNGSVTEFKEFEGRNHFVIGQPGWEGDAEYILHWLQN